MKKIANLFDLQAKITLDSKDYENSINDAEKKTGKFASGLKSKLGTAAKAGALAVGAAFVTITKKAVENYAQYEQLVGGVETLFGASGKSIEEYAKSVGKSVDDVKQEYNSLMTAQGTVLENAKNAYKTAGLSANEYMNTAIGFSGALLKSLGGDTEKAAEQTQMAIIDMADQANKYGGTVEDISQTYTSLARGNTQTLDNLFGGMFAGTKSGLEEMLKYAEDYRASLGETVDYSSDSYADIVSAIHDVSEATGVSGTTAKEAEDTISGSIASMKAAWANLTIGVADENADIEQLTQDLADSVEDVTRNLAPVIWTIIKTIFKTLVDIAIEKVMELKDKLLEKWEDIKQDVKDKWEDIKKDIRDKIQEIKDNTIGKVIEMKDEALQKIEDFKQGVGEKFETIKKKITDPVEEAKEKVSGFVEDIKGFFEGLKITLPKISLPHFSASYTPPKTAVGKAIWQKALGLEGKPVVSVDWYAKAMNNAMLLDSPTIFGMANGKYLGAGEAGQEVVAGSDTLMGMIRNAVKTENGGGNIINIYPQNLTEAQIDYLFTRFNAKMGAMA